MSCPFVQGLTTSSSNYSLSSAMADSFYRVRDTLVVS